MWSFMARILAAVTVVLTMLCSPLEAQTVRSSSTGASARVEIQNRRQPAPISLTRWLDLVPELERDSLQIPQELLVEQGFGNSLRRVF